MRSILYIILFFPLLAGKVEGQNPVIQACLAEVNADSIKATMQRLQDYGTRYFMAGNRKEIATWIMNRFMGYGYTAAALDSVQMKNSDTTLWQYNVVCTIPGISAPGEITVVGGHYDSFNTIDPMASAPGADDNASAVAATLEMARVIKVTGYQPVSTIRFVLFAAEESGFVGSWHQAGRSADMGEDIRLMYNMDMIAFDTGNVNTVFLFNYRGAESAYNLASRAIQQYTGLDVLPGPADHQNRSDSYVYREKGYQVTWAREKVFNVHYHSSEDIVANCNLSYCAEVTRGVLAGVLEMQYRPFPQGMAAVSSENAVSVHWKPCRNGNLKGFNIYRSENDSNAFQRLNTTMVRDTFFVDHSVHLSRDYYYYVTLVNDSMQESVPSPTVNGARFRFTDTLLVVACLKGEQNTPDSIRNFYDSVLDSIPHRWFEMNKSSHLTLATMSHYRNMLWVINSLEYDKITVQVAHDLEVFFANHGNMMFAGFSFARFMLGNIGFPSKIPETSIPFRYFRADSVDKRIYSYMYRTYPDDEDYDTLYVDTLKSFKPGFPGELYNIEVCTPAFGGNPIYRFDSKYDPGTTLGAQQGKIVGMEYMGNDFRTLLLSFPLFYLDTSDARRLMTYVVRSRFANQTGEPEAGRPAWSSLQIYPNPSPDLITIAGNEVSIRGELSVIHMSGRLALRQPIGPGRSTLNIGSLPAGIYIVKIVYENGCFAGKFIKN